MNKAVTIFSDGACRGNPGPGGWGVLLCWGNSKKKLYGAEPETTNNRMELTAAIIGLESLRQPCIVTVITDSQYVRNGITQWLKNWRGNDWQTAAKRPVKNKDLWQRLDKACAQHAIEWRWVKGHSGEPGNEYADQLANQAINEMLLASKQKNPI